MKIGLPWLSIAASVALLAIGCGAGKTRESAGALPNVERAQTGPDSAKLGSVCPDFSYSLIGGGTASPADYKGKHLLIYVTSYT